MSRPAGCRARWAVGAAWAGCFLSVSVWGHGDVHGQIDDVTRHLRDRPADVDAWLRRAHLYQLDGDWTAAAADFDRAEVLAPALAAVNLARGQMLLAAGRLDEAQTAIDRFLTEKPDHVEGLLTRARLAVRRSRPLQAVVDFRRAIDRATQPDPEVFVECARAWASAEPPRWAEAVAVLDQGIGRLGNLPALGVPALDFEVRMGRFEAALARVDRLGAGAARPETWMLRRGDILRQAGRRGEAAEAYRAALAAMDRQSPTVQARPATQALRKELERSLASVARSSEPTPEPAR